MRRRAALPLALVAFAACSGESGSTSTSTPAATVTLLTIVGVAQYGIYSPADGTYSIMIPKGWTATVDGDTLEFGDGVDTASVSVARGAERPTEASVRSRLTASMARRPSFALRSVTTVEMRGGAAVRANFDLIEDRTGVRLSIDHYELYARGTLAVLTLSHPADRPQPAAWSAVSDSLAIG